MLSIIDYFYVLRLYLLFAAKLWDARYGEVVHTFDHEHIVKSVNFNADDTMLVTASNEKLIRVFDMNKPESGRKYMYLLSNGKIEFNSKNTYWWTTSPEFRVQIGG